MIMASAFSRFARKGLSQAMAAAAAEGDTGTDFRAAVCRFENELFAAYPLGHTRMGVRAAEQMLKQIFSDLGLRPPMLSMVAGFADPRVGGYADIPNHRIAIERGHLYRFLVLHESAHLIAPADRRHGPAFTFVLQLLYRSFLGIPEEPVRRLLLAHGLPWCPANRLALAA
jgi:hypothetical protein